ncbi:hypothetical protein GCG54_00005715 [Colletotrichum gloeosporioides]|uniref:Uncharacterized protein n=1 Tax=Colletotrichum gloeosporioides TaxID=474922 RepID=A0A8H4CJ73_COLGL|nr:uncharacterized protein GCG54_00005715 [Colletotrichum gloeosporioides]KAF3804970.1 hypothetical protein GCG54_00005715 [Colletotrichum gloeosporioides]
MEIMDQFFPGTNAATFPQSFSQTISTLKCSPRSTHCGLSFPLWRGSRKVQNFVLAETTVAGVIAAPGAMRQTNCHFHGAIGIGMSVAAVQVVPNATEQVAKWNTTDFPGTLKLGLWILQ